MVWLDCSLWADRSTVLVGPDGPTWLLCMGWQIHCPGWSWWSGLNALYGLTDPLTWLDPDGLTWTLCMGWQIQSWLVLMVRLELLCMGWQINCPIHCPGWSWWSDLTALYGLTDPLSWMVLMIWLDCSAWTDRSTVLVGPDGLAWTLCMGWQIHCPGWSWWSDLTALFGLTDPLSNPLSWLVGPDDGLTWLLCMGQQIHCPGWSWWSDLTALHGLTDPLSWLVLMVWLDCSPWTDRSTVLVGPDGLTWLCKDWQILLVVDSCWGLELYSTQITFHDSTVIWNKLYVWTVTEIQSNKFHPQFTWFIS